MITDERFDELVERAYMLASKGPESFIEHVLSHLVANEHAANSEQGALVYDVIKSAEKWLRSDFESREACTTTESALANAVKTLLAYDSGRTGK